MDEDFVFKISLVLLCISLLLSIIVLFLIVWLAQIHHQVDSISKGWIVYCRLTPNQKTPATTQNQPEAQDTYSPLPLVFFNQQAADSDIVNSWKNINRAFAYASVRSDVDIPRPKTEGTDFALHVENSKSDDDSKTQEQTIRISDVPVTSYLQIVDNSSPIVAISTSECPIKDVKQGKRRIHISVGSADDDDDNYPERLEDCTQSELETTPLVYDEDSVSDDLKICCKIEANEQHVSLKKNDTSGTTKGSDTDRTEGFSVVSSEENREESAEFCIELHNVTSTKFDEQCIGKSSQEIETDNNANGRVLDGTKLANNTHSDESFALSEDSKKGTPFPGDESEQFISTKTRSKGKRCRKKKSVTDGINSNGKNGSEIRKRMAPLDNVNEDKSGVSSTQCIEQMGKTGRNSATDFQQTEQHTGEKVKSGAFSDNDEYQIVSYVDQCAVNDVATNVPLTQDYYAGSVSESDEKMKPEDYATNEDATERNGSPGIVSQLRDLLKRKSLTDSANSVDGGNKITVEDDTTESFSKDDYLTVVQENEAHEKYASEEYYSTATDLDDRQSPAEQIYSHVDESNDDLYCEIPVGAKPGVICVNHDDNKNVGDGFCDKVPIYANVGPQHGTVMSNGSHAFQNEYEFAIYSNDTIDV